MTEIKHAFGSNHALRPRFGKKVVEFVEIKRLTTEVNKRADAIFFSFAFIVVVMMVVAMLAVFVFMLMFVVVMVFVVVIVIIIIIIVVVMTFKFLNPCGRSCHFFEIEKVGV